jgi:hypothetical protein
MLPLNVFHKLADLPFLLVLPGAVFGEEEERGESLQLHHAAEFGVLVAELGVGVTSRPGRAWCGRNGGAGIGAVSAVACPVIARWVGRFCSVGTMAR